MHIYTYAKIRSLIKHNKQQRKTCSLFFSVIVISKSVLITLTSPFITFGILCTASLGLNLARQAFWPDRLFSPSYTSLQHINSQDPTAIKSWLGQFEQGDGLVPQPHP